MTTASVVAHEIRLNQLAFWRNPQMAFFTFALPLALLVGLGSTSGDDRTLLVPGLLAFGVVGSSYNNLAATVAWLRGEGVLKRVRAAPLPARTYLGAQIGSTLVSTVLIALATVATGALAFGVLPEAGRLPGLVLAFALGVTCFASLGLAVTALIPSPEAAGPVTNATFLPLALISGVFDPSQDLPGWLSTTMSWFPVKPLVEALRAGFTPASELHLGDLGVLLGWTLVGIAVTLRTFRWHR
jgi:ABC-2 type transport system permease protein